MRIRIHFSKVGFACFVSHIDLPMLFGRAARRAGLIAELTQGFSPHPKLALASPLPVGVAGLCEPADFWFDNWQESSFESWRAAMPQGIDILHATETSGVTLHKCCNAATYILELRNDSSAESVVRALESAMSSKDALLGIEVNGREIHLSSLLLEQAGASYMVKSLIAESVVNEWSDLRVSRIAVGRWSAEEKRVVSLMEEAL